jgi:hypothetical protein
MSASNGLVSKVMISTTVESLASCSRSSCHLSTARLQDPATVDPSTDVVRLDASLVDVDNLPIRISSPTVYAIWNNETFPLERDAPGSNRFRWEIPSSLRREPGTYTFQVFLEQAWDEVLGAKTRCKLLEGTVSVAKGFNTTWVLIGSILGAIILIGVALFVVRRYHEQLMHIAVMLITEVVKLGFSISLDIGEIITEYESKTYLRRKAHNPMVRAVSSPPRPCSSMIHSASASSCARRTSCASSSRWSSPPSPSLAASIPRATCTRCGARTAQRALERTVAPRGSDCRRPLGTSARFPFARRRTTAPSSCASWSGS